MSELFQYLAKFRFNMPNLFAQSREYIQPCQGDAHNDFGKVVSDMRSVGDDLRKVSEKELARYVK